MNHHGKSRSSFLIELAFLNGLEKLDSASPIHSLISYLRFGRKVNNEE
jgi:hypothetical protein